MVVRSMVILKDQNECLEFGYHILDEMVVFFQFYPSFIYFYKIKD